MARQCLLRVGPESAKLSARNLKFIGCIWELYVAYTYYRGLNSVSRVSRKTKCRSRGRLDMFQAGPARKPYGRLNLRHFVVSKAELPLAKKTRKPLKGWCRSATRLYPHDAATTGRTAGAKYGLVGRATADPRPGDRFDPPLRLPGDAAASHFLGAAERKGRPIFRPVAVVRNGPRKPSLHVGYSSVSSQSIGFRPYPPHIRRRTTTIVERKCCWLCRMRRL